ncbi:exonuclease subunit SbcD [Undibacterium squillarum]|uniref:Nuclease SbcCD subunit D n=1 Tax=Undibacterium squillarum TaxID=1131567 RepID=A0ABQ2XUE9_9BURK|nr:exonuclease subunit SbcD [Undibacterium squillarum]GGX34796.1 nuclease SbcCD subunit D [Undibacterium squillarum]
MRLLHTSDWHLGQHFMGKTRQAEHEALIQWLLQQVQQHAVDVVLIAGDVFDTGAPPSYARELYNQLILQLHDAGTRLIVLAGNHDSVATLEESRQLAGRLGATVIPALSTQPAEQVITLHDRQGKPAAVLCAVPFIRPRDVLQSQAGQSAEEKQLSLQEAIFSHYQQLYALAEDQRHQHGQLLPVIATGHLTTVGASASESVREIYVGALQAFPTTAFPPTDYIALGHIHRPQLVGGLNHIRYSGSPLTLSFDELGQKKQMLLVDLNEDGLQQVTPLEVPVFQAMATVRGSLAELENAIAQAAQAGSAERPVWLEVTVCEDDYLSDLQTRVQSISEGHAVEVLRIRRDRSEAIARLQAESRVTLEELQPQDVFSQRLAPLNLQPDVQTELQSRFETVMQALQGAAE